MTTKIQFTEIGHNSYYQFSAELGRFDEASKEYAAVRQEIHDVARWCSCNCLDGIQFYLERETFAEYGFSAAGELIAVDLPSKISVFVQLADVWSGRRFKARWISKRTTRKFNTPIPSTVFKTKRWPGLATLVDDEHAPVTQETPLHFSSRNPQSNDHFARVLAYWCKDARIEDWSIQVANVLPYSINVPDSGIVSEQEINGGSTLHIKFTHLDDAIKFKLTWVN